MRVGSLFAGIGGFDLGLERAGMEVVWQVEIDNYCNKVLEKHWPDVRRYRDVKKVGKENLEPVDVICGGFPCQPFSVAGKQKGKEDDRYLWPQMFRIIKELRPSWIIIENVTGFIDMGLDICISNLENEGYTCQAFIIPACAINTQHRRDRLWIVGNSNSSNAYRQNGIRRTTNKSFKEWSDSENLKTRGGGVSQLGTTSDMQQYNSYARILREFHGIPDRMDRLKGLGNAVVPQIPEIIGRAIMEIENNQERGNRYG